MLTRFHSLGWIDVLGALRDPLLRWMPAVPLLAALAMRWVLPELVANLELWLHLPLTPYYPELAGFALLILVPQLLGMVTGFLLLDQKDDRTLVALLVTPLSFSGYLLYRLVSPLPAATLLTLLAFLLSGLPVDRGSLALCLLGTLPVAPLMALFLGGFAKNKVQGFALAKISGIFLALPIVAYFIPHPWHLAVGCLTPLYGPAMAFWILPEDSMTGVLYLLLGLVVQFLLLIFFIRRLRRYVAV